MLHGVPITPSASASGLIDLLPMPILALSTQRDVASETALQHNSLPPQVLMTPFTHWWMIKCSPMQYCPLWLILEMRCPSVDQALYYSDWSEQIIDKWLIQSYSTISRLLNIMIHLVWLWRLVVVWRWFVKNNNWQVVHPIIFNRFPLFKYDPAHLTGCGLESRRLFMTIIIRLSGSVTILTPQSVCYSLPGDRMPLLI